MQWARNFRRKHSVLISAVNIAELCATGDSTLRKKLLQFCYELLPGENKEDKLLPADFPFNLLRKSLESYVKKLKEMHKKGYVDAVDFCLKIEKENMGLWEALLHPERVDEEARNECKKYAEEQKKWYNDMHVQGREAFQKHKESATEDETESKIEVEAEEEFMYTAINSPSMQRALLENTTRGLADEIVKNIDIWRIFYTGLIYEIYNRGIKTTDYGKEKNPGSLDVQQELYLYWVKIFVTDDKPFLEHIRAVVKYLKMTTEVWDFQYFKEQVGIE